MCLKNFHAEKVTGGWIVSACNGSIADTRVIIKDNALVKEFKNFVKDANVDVDSTTTSVQQLNEG